MIEQFNVLLSQLKFGEQYPGNIDIDSRVEGRGKDVEQLAASIDSEGLLQPLLICRGPDGRDFYVVDGNRRLAALRLRHGGDDLYSVPVIDAGDITPLDALRKSLVANDCRLPLHPVDRHAAFAQCHAEGKSAAEIAAQYATDERTVKQSLALGRLAPVVRSAWRTGELTAEEAQTFALSNDHVQQDKVFRKLKKKKELDREAIREALVGDQRKIAPVLEFVGREAYEAAGGAVIEDLFGDEQWIWDEDDQQQKRVKVYAHAVSDPALLQKLVDEKLRAKCDELVADGWSWAAVESELPDNARYNWQCIAGITKKNATDAQKKKSGCIVVFLARSGQTEIIYGVVNPADKSGKEAKADKKKEKAKAADSGATKELPRALAQDLIEQKTRAAALAMKSDAHVAIAILLAGFRAFGEGPCTVSARGLGNNSDDPDEFLTAFEQALKMKPFAIMGALSHVAAEALDFRVSEATDAEAIFAALPDNAVNEACREAWAAPDYFDRAPKDIALQAIAEALGADQAKAVSGKKKPEIAEFAAKECPKKGWLPPELRTVHYDGPGAKAAKPKAKKKGGKK